MRPIPAFVLLPAALVAPAAAYAAEYLTVPQAQQLLFAEADRFVDAAVELSDDQRKAIEDKSGVRQRWKKQAVWRAEKAGQLLGWFIVDEVVGKHEFITYAAGLTPDGKVRGIEILAYRETHGYQVRNPEWRHHFEGKTLADPFKLEQDIPNIAGATLSCKNVTNGVKRLLALQQVMLR
ncbi:MAG TPA: FMN-binding protein [Burkholderiales bacterium]|nr:FMN-binding protein [Burkholderiales bacterium]